ncbi:MAG TPA: GRAS family protein [Flavipsychrobacter sp.]|nr:GRAS family protein [Flavipsychrobacter sp.]
MKDQLHQLGSLLEAHHSNERNELLHEMITSCAIGKNNDSEKMLAYLMAVNLRKRFSGEGIKENLYKSTDGVSQIRLFDILIHQFPFVKYSQQMTNDAILRMLQQHEEVCMIDIGIGLGTQMLHILEKAKEFTHLRKLTIVGIEPFENALRTAGEQIVQYKEQLAFELEFIPVLNYVEATDLSLYRPDGAACIVNASLALHHIKSSADRDRVIADIRALQPEAFLLIEPNVNHFTNDLATRILNSYEHFIGIFRVIDRLDISNEDKNGLKLFFGRELEDILSKADEERFEKHEPVSAWLHRMGQNGFQTDSNALLAESKEVLGVSIRPFPEGYIGFSEQDETILAVMFAY